MCVSLLLIVLACKDAPVSVPTPEADCGTLPAYQPLLEDPGLGAQAATVAFGGMMAIADIDGNGALDIVIGQLQRTMLLMGTLGTLRFTDESAARIDFAEMTAWPLSVVDIDQDGDQDIILIDENGGTRLSLNDGQGYFSEAPLTGWPEFQTHPRSLAWGDLDEDGDLDAYQADDGIGNWEPKDILLERLEGINFQDRQDVLPAAASTSYARVASLIDLDGDGHQDLHVVSHISDLHGGDAYYRGDGDWNFETHYEAGLNLAISGMGAAYADTNADALPDILLSDWGGVHLMESDPGLGWYDSAQALGLNVVSEMQVSGWGNALEDLDNDGDIDALTVFGPGGNEEAAGQGSNPSEQPDAVWLREGDSFVAYGAELGLDQTSNGRGITVVDLDQDGLLDIVKQPVDEPVGVWKGLCGSASWLEVSVQGPPHNLAGVGARVQVRSGDQIQTRWLMLGGSSHGVTVPVRAHFGLGTAQQVDEVRVLLPGFPEQILEDVAIGQHLQVTIH